MKKQRLNHNRNKGESTLTNSTGKKKAYNSYNPHASQISSSVAMSEE
jgi:hypothetical protein